jgi:hypothetical protein
MATPPGTGESTSSDADDIALDHPHEGSGCAFCAARRAPMQHRLWCAIYLQRCCNCGNGQQP